jgi:uncharacterized MAPEG superfamily protein
LSTELKMLAWSIALGFVYVLVAGFLATQQRGVKWNVGNRDGTQEPLSGAASRAARAGGNFLETFGFFAAAVLAVTVAKQNTDQTALGSELYFWARVLYLPIYIAGIPYVRTVVWAVSIWGIIKVLWVLF